MGKIFGWIKWFSFHCCIALVNHFSGFTQLFTAHRSRLRRWLHIVCLWICNTAVSVKNWTSQMSASASHGFSFFSFLTLKNAQLLMPYVPVYSCLRTKGRFSRYLLFSVLMMGTSWTAYLYLITHKKTLSCTLHSFHFIRKCWRNLKNAWRII